MTTIQQLLRSSQHSLMSSSESAQLDAELLLAAVLKLTRSGLHRCADRVLSATEIAKFNELLMRRQRGEPIAYLLGQREFWSLMLTVTPDTLIPRPDTEVLVETALAMLPEHAHLTIADLGTGSGAIALALAHERHLWQVYATDQSAAALQVAAMNAQQLACEHITFLCGDWCAALPEIAFDAIISNPPYIAEHDPHLQQGDLRFEPRSALVAAENGLHAIQQIVQQAPRYLRQGGWLMLEIGYQQAPAVLALLQQTGFQDPEIRYDLAGHARVVIGQLN